jgi:hypothetical protein
LLRIYVYMVVTIYCTTIIFENIKKWYSYTLL